MKTKQKKLIIGIIAAVVIIGVIIGVWAYYSNFIASAQGKILSVKAYNNGKEVSLTSGTYQSVLGNPGVHITDLSFLTKLTNTGTTPLLCNVISASPSALSNAIVKTAQTINPGETAYWSSGNLSSSLFENPASTTFTVTARCSYTLNSQTINLADQTGTITLLIQKDPTTTNASFTVDVVTDSSGTTCGDHTCQASESAVNCPQDCVVTSSVKFRTTDLTYAGGTAIGYSSSCGSLLTKYGKTSGACTDKYCDGTPDLLIPGNPSPTKLFISGSDICICPPGTTTHSYSLRYTTEDADASKVSNSALSISSEMEVAC